MSIRKCNVLRSDDYVREREMDGRSGWYNGAQTTIKLQTFQGRCRDIHLHLCWISLSSADAQTQLARVYVRVYGTDLPTQITVCQLMPLLCLICVRAPACVCVCICANTSVFVCLLAAPIRLASRLIAEGSASFSGPNHSQHSAMSSMPVTYGQHLFFVSFWLTSLLFLSSWYAQMNIHPLAPYAPFFCQEWFSLSVFNTRHLTGKMLVCFFISTALTLIFFPTLCGICSDSMQILYLCANTTEIHDSAKKCDPFYWKSALTSASFSNVHQGWKHTGNLSRVYLLFHCMTAVTGSSPSPVTLNWISGRKWMDRWMDAKEKAEKI